MSQIKLLTASSGSIALEPANTSSNLVIQVPAVTGTMITTASTFAGTGPTFRVWASVNQSISAATPTKIVYQQEDWDTNNNISSSRFTPTVAGYYYISAGTRTQSAGGTEWVTYIDKNGGTYAHGSNNSATGINLSLVSTLVYLNGSTDYVEIWLYPGPNAATTINSGAYVYFTGSLVRAA